MRSRAPRPRRRARPPSDAEIETEPVAEVAPTLALDGMGQPAQDPIERHMQIREARRFGIIGMLDWPELHDPKLKFQREMSGEEVALMERLFTPD